MLTLITLLQVTLLQALIVSGTIVFVTYCLMRFAAYCVLWLIDKLSFEPSDDRHRHADPTPICMLPKRYESEAMTVCFSYFGETNHASVE